MGKVNEIVNQIHPIYIGERFPLTRHMVAYHDRFEWANRFDLNSERSRLDYLAFYIWEVIGFRPIALDLTDTNLLHDLNQEIVAYGPLTVFWHAVWKLHFRNKYDVYTEEGYYGFISQIAVVETPARHLPTVLISTAMKVELTALQSGFHDPWLTRTFYQIWSRSRDLQEKYPDIGDSAIRDAFMLEQIMRLMNEQGLEFLLSAEQERYWTTSHCATNPKISRFVMGMALLSPRFRPTLESGRLNSAGGDAIERWWIDEVVDQIPKLARLAPGLTPLPMNFDTSVHTRLGRIATVEAVVRPDPRQGEIEVLVIGPYGSASGLGTGMRRTIGALVKGGVDFRVLPFYYDQSTPIQAMESSFRKYDGEMPRVIIWHYNAEYIYDVMTVLSDLAASSYNIGYFFWETEVIPKAHSLAIDLVDEIWAPSEFCARSYADKGVPVTNVGSSIELPDVGRYLTREELGIEDDVFVVVFTFDSHSVIHRKNPAAVVRTFLKAFPVGDEKARLIIKTQNMATAHWNNIKGRGLELIELCNKDPRITFFDKTMSLRELYSLKKASNVYVSLHRSEGYGYGPAEAMALGKPVIMTNYSANVEFAEPGNCLLVDGPLIHVALDEYLYVVPEMKWADPDVAQAATMLRRLYDDPELAASIGKSAAETINRSQSGEAMGKRINARLEELSIIDARRKGC